MKMTLVKFAGVSLLLGIFLTISTVVSFANPKPKKTDSSTKTHTFHLTGQVVKVNAKDHSFELVNDKGDHYLVHMDNDTLINRYAPSAYQKHILNFDDLFVGVRVSLSAEQPETVASTPKPMPVVAR